MATKTGSFSGGFRVISAALVGAAALILALKLYPRPVPEPGGDRPHAA